jgi:hypothetical protein
MIAIKLSLAMAVPFLFRNQIRGKTAVFQPGIVLRISDYWLAICKLPIPNSAICAIMIRVVRGVHGEKKTLPLASASLAANFGRYRELGWQMHRIDSVLQ